MLEVRPNRGDLLMDTNQMKSEAAVAANEIQINWDAMENPKYRHEFESVLKRASNLVPELEQLYEKLSSGKSVINSDDDTPLNFTDVEKYRGLIEEELFNGYVLQELYHKYNMVNAVIAADEQNPLDKLPPEQLDFNL